MRENLTVDEALDEILGQLHPSLHSHTVGLMEAYGAVLAADLASTVDHPAADDTAVDGYACLEADTLSAGAGHPVKLEVIGQAPAGKPFEGTIVHGQAVQVFTGAPIPAGADAVIRVEDTLREEAVVWLMRPASPADIRRKGDDLHQGQTYLQKGDLLNPGRIGLAAAMGYAQLEVFRPPKVGILSTGDEVVEPGQPLPHGGVYNSNSYSVAALVKEAGAEPILLGKVSDDIAKVRKQLEQAGQIDLLLTTGGVSMGEYDMVRKLLEAEGKIHFWKVKMQPGGPFLFAEWSGVPLMGLPGNPVSAMVAFLLFGRPAIYKLLSRRDPPYNRIKAVCDTPFSSNPTKRVYRRAIMIWKNGHFHVSSTGNQSSQVLHSMAIGNCLVMMEPTATARAGDVVDIIPLAGEFREKR